MSSPTRGASIGSQQVSDLLHKLASECKKVQAAFVTPPSGVQAFVHGVLRVSRPTLGDGILVNVIEHEHDPETPRLCFDPAGAVSCRYGDDRVLKTDPAAAGFFKEHFSSVMTFLFADGSVVALYECTDQE